MTASNAAPRSRKGRGAAARSEVNGRPKVSDRPKKLTLSNPVFKGLKLAGPKTLPATFSWDLAEARAATDELSVMGAFYKLIVSVVGNSNAVAIRQRLVEKAPSVKDGGGELMSSVLTDIIGQYGMEEGES